MSELKSYQKKAIGSKKKVVFCNWKRGAGKTYAISEDVAIKSLWCEEGNNLVVISLCDSRSKCRLISEYLRKHVGLEITQHNNILKVKNRNNIITNVFFIIHPKEISQFGMLRGVSIDNIYIDDYMPTKDEIDYLSNLNISGKIKIYYSYFDNEEFEYISDVEDKIDKNKWTEIQVEELMKEYSNIPKSENTTIRREKVLYQMKMLQEVFKIK